MAIALDSEIRSAVSLPASGKTSVRPASTESGDDFASLLKQARKEVTDDAPPESAGALAAAPPQIIPLTHEWSEAPAPMPAGPAPTPQTTATQVDVNQAPLLAAAWAGSTVLGKPAVTTDAAISATDPGQVPLLDTAQTEAPAPAQPVLVSPAGTAPATPAPAPKQAPTVGAPEVSELRTDRELVESDIQATQAEAATPNAGQQTNLTGQTEAEIAPAPAPQTIAAHAAPQTDAAGAPLPEVTAPSSGASMATVATSGLVAMSTAQTPANGDKSAQNPAPAAPKAAAKLATIAKADGDSASLPSPATGILPEIAAAPLTGLSDAAGLETNGPAALGSSSISFASMAPGAPQQPAPLGTVLAAPFTSPGPVLVAVPAEIVDIVSKTAEDGQSDRVVVQLDPPELGRVSIDFKFDAQGVQHVIITSETPEAMRQLRQMHSELVQALERQGIGSQNMTFQHQQQSQQQSPQANPLLRMAATGAGAASASLLTAIQPQPSSPQLSAGGRLDIRL